MYKKLSYKALFIILLVLVVVYFVIELTGSKERSFKEMVLVTDTATINKLTIDYPEAEKVDITLVKESDKWLIDMDGQKLMTDRSLINSVLAPLAGMKTDRVGATGPSAWERFEVTDSTGIRVTAYKDNKVLEEFYAGKFSYQQPNQQNPDPRMKNQGKMISYIRSMDDDIVYGVEGFLKMTYNKEPDHFRFKTLTKLDANEVKSVTFNYADRTFVLNRKDTQWLLNNQPVDSAKTTRYVRILCNQRGVEFADDFDLTGKDADYNVIIEGNNFSPVVLQAYLADTARQQVVTSNFNPDGKFSGKRSDVFKKIFVNEDRFFADVE